MRPWTPITAHELQALIRLQLQDCTATQRSIFEQHRVELRKTPIIRYGTKEFVFIVAERDNEVMYYEDVEERFNFSPLTKDGEIAQHWCNQDELKFALIRWQSPAANQSLQRTPGSGVRSTL